ncbi:Holliday junction branch migration protein RuvA [Candidatus Falkowbacteria bacterium]|nr:Holliday junction branch migration protein RuvA [Candidatus Falkowbacteria bacterium]
MLSYIKGQVKLKTEQFLIVENAGIGYKVYVSADLLLELKVGDEVELYTYQHVREDALMLFGFKNYDQLQLFELLISISGVGPKTALGVFAVAEPADIKSAIVNEDASVLKKVSGIGAKTAERIVLELKNKVTGDFGEIKTKEELSGDVDSIEALVSLGYSANDAREALKQVDKTITNPSDKVREALKYLGK